MEASKSAAPAPGRPSVALDILMLAGASIVAGLVTAAVAALLVILLNGPADTAADAPDGPPAGTAASAATS